MISSHCEITPGYQMIEKDPESNDVKHTNHQNCKQLLHRPSVKIYKEPEVKPSVVPAFFVLGIFGAVYVYLQQDGTISVPSNQDFLQGHPLTTGIVTLIGVANMFNHVAGYMQPVPMWSLFVGAFIDFNSGLLYAIIYYLIGYMPAWLIVAWIFQMGIHSYYMSTGLVKPDSTAIAFSSLMAHMHKLQTNTTDWWNTLFLYYDMIFHLVFLVEVMPSTPFRIIVLDAILSIQLYKFLYMRSVDPSTQSKRPIMYIDAVTNELRCPCSACNRSNPFKLGCSQWFASIEQLYFDCWGVFDENGVQKAKTLIERFE